MRLTFGLAALALLAGPALGQPVDPAAPAPAPSPEPKPPMIDQSGISPESLRDIDQLWDDRSRSSVAAAQALQGPLDGRWLLVADDATPLFVFQFVDPAGGRGPLEGVWRDLRRPPHTGAYGVVPGLQRIGMTLNLSFLPPGTSTPVRIALQGDPAGGWQGQMTENGAVTTVSLRRSY
jgi:hypothetical protein